MIDIDKIADEANIIINGYAFTLKESQYKVINLNKPQRAALLDYDGNAVLQNRGQLNDRELRIVQEFI